MTQNLLDLVRKSATDSRLVKTSQVGLFYKRCFLGAFNYFTAHFKRTMHWSTVGNTMIRHILQHTRLLKNFTSRLEQNDVSMSSKAKSFFDLHLESIDWNKCKPNDKVLCRYNFKSFPNVPLTHYFVNSQFSSSLETDLNENDEYLTPALLLEFSAECGSEEISSALPSNYNAKAARKDANLAALSALPVIFSLDDEDDLISASLQPVSEQTDVQ